MANAHTTNETDQKHLVPVTLWSLFLHHKVVAMLAALIGILCTLRPIRSPWEPAVGAAAAKIQLRTSMRNGSLVFLNPNTSLQRTAINATAQVRFTTLKDVMDVYWSAERVLAPVARKFA